MYDCTYHQNMKLLLPPVNVAYQDLFPLTVCDTYNKVWYIDAKTSLRQTHYCKIFCFTLLEILMMIMMMMMQLKTNDGQLLINLTLFAIHKLLTSMLTL